MNINLAPIDYLKEQHVHTCIFSQPGISTHTFQSYVMWSETATQIGIGHTAEAAVLVPGLKNTLVSTFLNFPKLTHLLFIDADVRFEPWQVLALLSAKKHIIGPVNQYCTTKMLDEVDTREVDNVDGGFMMISREAFEHLKDHPRVSAFSDDSLLRSYFETTVRKNIEQDESWEFCNRWRDIGGHVWSHKSVNITRS